MKRTPPPTDAMLPDGIARAVAQVRARTNAWIAFDASLAGLATGVAFGAPVAAVLWIARMPIRWALLAGGLTGAFVVVREARARWFDSFAAASTLDALLDAKDRFVSALHFAVAADKTTFHDLQIQEAESFLERCEKTPSAPRPGLRFPRFVVAALALTLVSLLSPFARKAFAHWHWHRALSTNAAAAESDSPQAIAARAAALREALRDSPGRRIDAEINALEHALDAQVARAEAARAQAIERAAAAIEQAYKDDQLAAQQNTHGGALPNGLSPSPNTTPTGTTESPETRAAREALALAQRERETAQASESAVNDALRRAQAALEAAHHANDPSAAQRAEQQRAQLAAQLAQIQAMREAATQHETQAQQNLAQAQTRDAANQGLANAHPTQSLQSPQGQQGQPQHAVSLDDAVRHLDDALQSIQRTDRSAEVPSAHVGQALDQASREMGQQMPDTSHALGDASRARDANDGQRVDEALARARASLAREAHAEPDDVRRAREAVDALHDQAAQNAQDARLGQGDDRNDSQRGNQSQQGRNGSQASMGREQDALHNPQDGQQGQNGQEGTAGEQGQTAQLGQNGQQGQNGQDGQQGENGQDGQGGEQGQGGQPGQQGQSGQRGQFAQSGQSGQNGQGSWGQGMQPFDPASGMQGSQSQMGHGANGAAQQGGTGGDIGNNQGNGAGMGLSQGNRLTDSGQAGSQTASRFNRGNGATEHNGRNQMSGQGPGQAQGTTGSQGGGTAGGANQEPTEGGRAWGTGAGGALTQAPAGTPGPFGHDLDPGGQPGQQAQLAPNATGVMMPGVAQQGAPTGPTMESPVAPGSLLPNAPGNGALGHALDEDPEQTMATQRVPPSLRAYVRRYFQGIQGGSSTVHQRSP